MNAIHRYHEDEASPATPQPSLKLIVNLLR